MAIFTNSLIPSRSMYPHHPVYATERRLGVRFQNPNLLKTALTHSSYLNEHPGENIECNQRLEFLGDAVLGLAIAATLYKKDSEIQEGTLTLIRSLVVDGKTLARVARRLELGENLLMGSGEEKTGGRERNSNLAATVEAIMGAIYIDKGEMGYYAARDFCIRILGDEIDSAYNEVTFAPQQPAKSQSPNEPKPFKTLFTAGKHPKSALQEIVQAKYGVTPEYRITEATGKSNAKTFTAQVRVNGKALGSGKGSSKKAAETAAAQTALKAMQDTR